MARKPKQVLSRAAKYFGLKIRERFPDAEYEVVPESYDRFDLWIVVKVPADMLANLDEILDASFDLTEEIYEQVA